MTLDEFPVVITVPLLWGDLDAFGHVNNLAYLRWCETARIEYFAKIGLWTGPAPDGVAPILANVSCDYRAPLNYPDTVRVGSRVTRVGTSSIRMEHRVVSDGLDLVAADVTSVIVMFDYAARKSTPVPQPVRDAIAKLEAGA